MSIPPLEATGYASPTPVRAPKQVMDGEVFLHLLVTQLANQDPSSPMDTNQMISQTAQLAAMERLNTLADSQQTSLDIQQRTAAAALIGQQVTTGGASPLTGPVESVSFIDGTAMLSVNGQQIAFEQVTTIAAAPDSTPPSSTPPAATPPVQDAAESVEQSEPAEQADPVEQVDSVEQPAADAEAGQSGTNGSTTTTTTQA